VADTPAVKTILFTDIEGSTRLWEDAPEQMRRALSCHDRLVRAAVERHAGILVKTTGDGLLLEFSSVVDAVRCAVDVQRGMAERNAGVSPEQQLTFRIGIHVGDVIVEGDDIFGDGVNVAARLQALAAPGGICVSQRAYEDVRDRLPVGVQIVGPRHADARVLDLAAQLEAVRGAAGELPQVRERVPHPAAPDGSGGRSLALEEPQLRLSRRDRELEPLAQHLHQVLVDLAPVAAPAEPVRVDRG